MGNIAPKHILVVDDDPDFLTLLSQRLSSWGYKVSTVDEGEKALELVQEQRPDLILLDIMLPKMKGREVCLRLKQDSKTAGIPVIFLSALGLADHIRAGMDLGAEDYIVKPFQSEELKERIEVCLSRSASRKDG